MTALTTAAEALVNQLRDAKTPLNSMAQRQDIADILQMMSSQLKKDDAIHRGTTEELTQAKARIQSLEATLAKHGIAP